MLNKKAQLGIIEMKFFIYGLLIGILAAFLLTYLMNAGFVPFKIPLITCK